MVSIDTNRLSLSSVFSLARIPMGMGEKYRVQEREGKEMKTHGNDKQKGYEISIKTQKDSLHVPSTVVSVTVRKQRTFLRQ